MPRPKFEDVTELENLKSVSSFIIGCGGFTEAIYFQEMAKERADIKIIPLPPDEETHLSSPLQTVERVEAFWKKFDIEDDDQVWVVLDVDHFFTGAHLDGTDRALGRAWRQNYQVAISNPCFELWLLLHTEEVIAPWPDCDSLIGHLRVKWGSYGKRKLSV